MPTHVSSAAAAVCLCWIQIYMRQIYKQQLNNVALSGVVEGRQCCLPLICTVDESTCPYVQPSPGTSLISSLLVLR
jgi:hypothetical protein